MARTKDFERGNLVFFDPVYGMGVAVILTVMYGGELFSAVIRRDLC